MAVSGVRTQRSLLILTIVAALIGIASWSFASTTPSGDRAAIIALERQLEKAWIQHDAATVGPLIADTFTYWSFKGIRRTKADLLRTVANNEESNSTVSDVAVQIYGDAAVYSAIVTDTTTKNGSATQTRSAVMDFLVRTNGKWQIVASQETPISPGTGK